MKPADWVRFYRGGSMTGTFKEGDRLMVSGVDIGKINKGDVVVFRDPSAGDRENWIVHRVVGVTGSGLITRGDANPDLDAGLVTGKELLGKVSRLDRDGIVRLVHGGFRGCLTARRAYLRCYTIGRMKRFLAPLYRRLRRSRVVGAVWRPRITRITLKADDGELIKFIHRKRTVAWWWPQSRRFHCRKPYDLILKPPDDHPL